MNIGESSYTEYAIITQSQYPWAEPDKPGERYSVQEVIWLLAILEQMNFRGEMHLSLKQMMDLIGIRDHVENRIEAAKAVNGLLNRNGYGDFKTIVADRPADPGHINDRLDLRVALTGYTSTEPYVRITCDEFRAIRQVAQAERKSLDLLMLLFWSIKASFSAYKIGENIQYGGYIAISKLAQRSGSSYVTIGAYLLALEKHGVICSLSGKQYSLANAYALGGDREVLSLVMDRQGRNRVIDKTPEPNVLRFHQQRGTC